ncbi:hypothetical protein AN477_15295 [Alicyclobacillus ferrooxydans]|uniref:Uncharacterized protein n=2 Tax=Alicyclobacillus ferrooxydans TaxID=471514 RepID=A0A0P9D0C2_9BACL|nr:hypothetical protein AN477_15295 [Alicyclobacillus ferrooxydans]
MSVLFQLLCRGHLLWWFQAWGLFTDKLSSLTQFVLMFPFSTVLFLSHIPRKRFHAVLYYLGFVAVYVLMEVFLNLHHEIIYRYNWSFFWSVLIDFCLFAVEWVHAKSWKIAVPISACMIAFLMVWFRVPLDV